MGHGYKGIYERMQKPVGINPFKRAQARGKTSRRLWSPQLCLAPRRKGRGRGGRARVTEQDRQVVASRQHQHLPKSPCWPCPCRLAFGNAGLPQPSLWDHLRRESGSRAPFALPSAPLLRGPWRGGSCTSPPCADGEPPRCYGCAVSRCPRENCSCFADSRVTALRVRPGMSPWLWHCGWHRHDRTGSGCQNH